MPWLPAVDRGALSTLTVCFMLIVGEKTELLFWHVSSIRWTRCGGQKKTSDTQKKGSFWQQRLISLLLVLIR